MRSPIPLACRLRSQTLCPSWVQCLEHCQRLFSPVCVWSHHTNRSHRICCTLPAHTSFLPSLCKGLLQGKFDLESCSVLSLIVCFVCSRSLRCSSSFVDNLLRPHIEWHLQCYWCGWTWQKGFLKLRKISQSTLELPDSQCMCSNQVVHLHT